MSFKALFLLAITAMADARPVTVSVAHAPYPVARSPLAVAPILSHTSLAVGHSPIAEDYDPHPQYSFAYDIKDAITGDQKDQHETRDGDVVQGSYSLVEPDGTKRTVEYTADPVNGFNAIVHKEAVAHVAPVAAVHTPLIAHAPVYSTPFITHATNFLHH